MNRIVLVVALLTCRVRHENVEAHLEALLLLVLVFSFEENRDVDCAYPPS